MIYQMEFWLFFESHGPAAGGSKYQFEFLQNYPRMCYIWELGLDLFVCMSDHISIKEVHVVGFS